MSYLVHVTGFFGIFPRFRRHENVKKNDKEPNGASNKLDNTFCTRTNHQKYTDKKHNTNANNIRSRLVLQIYNYNKTDQICRKTASIWYYNQLHSDKDLSDLKIDEI